MIKWLNQPKKLQTILMGYWLVAPVLFYTYLFLSSLQSQVSVQTLIQQVPEIALGNLTISLMLLQACLLFFISRLSQSKDGLLGHFMIIAILQQLITVNLIGVGLGFLFYRSLLPVDEKIESKIKLIFYLLAGFVLLISGLLFFVILRLRLFN